MRKTGLWVCHRSIILAGLCLIFTTNTAHSTCPKLSFLINNKGNYRPFSQRILVNLMDSSTLISFAAFAMVSALASAMTLALCRYLVLAMALAMALARALLKALALAGALAMGSALALAMTLALLLALALLVELAASWRPSDVGCLFLCRVVFARVLPFGRERCVASSPFSSSELVMYSHVGWS